MRRTLAVALLLADLRPAAGFQPIRDRPGLTHLLPEHLTIAGPTATALRYANDPHSAADPAGGGASSSALPDTADPLVLLGLDAMAAHDVAAIKAAYRRMTRRHHPDAVLTSASTDGEKRAANDNFARINEAYQNLLSRQKAMGRGYGGEEFGAQTFVDLESTGYSSSWAANNAHSTAGGSSSNSQHHWQDASATASSYHSATTSSSSPGDSTVREHFQRSADAFRRHGRAGAREDTKIPEKSDPKVERESARAAHRQMCNDAYAADTAAAAAAAADKGTSQAQARTATSSTSMPTEPRGGEEQPLTDLWENTKRTSPFKDLFERGRETFRKHTGGSKAAESSSSSGTSGGNAWWTQNHEPPAQSYDASTTTTTSYHSATSSPGDSTVREHFQRSVDAFRRHGRAGAREEECPPKSDPKVERERARAEHRKMCNDAYGANFDRATSQAKAQTAINNGEYASAANCPRDPSLADMFQRSAEDFERFGRAGSRPSTTTPSGSYEVATEGCHTRDINDLFSQSAEQYKYFGGKRKESEYFHKTNARTYAAKTDYPYGAAVFATGGGSSARVGKAAHTPDFFTNGRRTYETRPRSSRQPYKANNVKPQAEEKKTSSSGGVYAYSFGSAVNGAAHPAPAPATPQGPTPSESYASMLREKEKALEAKIAALRQSEAEAQARYEYLHQEMTTMTNGAYDPAASMDNFAATDNEQAMGNAVEVEVEEGRVSATTIRSESGSNIKFGINIVGGRRMTNNDAALTP